MTRFNSTNQTLTKVDKIITGNDKIDIKKSNTSVASADVKKKIIYLNENQIYKSHDPILNLSLHKGLNYHEVAHLLYTRVSMNKTIYTSQLNILEDLKIENLFAQKYLKAKKYFKNNILKLADLNVPEVYLGIYGRRNFLDPIIVKGFAKKFEEKFGAEKRTKAEEIIDEYITNHVLERSYKLAEDLYYLLRHDDPDIDKAESSNYNSLNGTGGKNDTRKVQKEIEELKKGLQKCGTDEKAEPTEEEVQEKIVQEKTDVEEKIEEELKPEIGGAYEEGNLGHEFYPTSKDMSRIFHMTRLLKTIKNELKSGYVHKIKKGRFDIRQVIANSISQKASSRVFKKYQPDRKNETALGVTIQLDSSGSVSDMDFEKEMASAYTICQALEKTKSYSEVYEFSNKFRVIKPMDKKHGDWKRQYKYRTHPSDALVNSHNELLKLKTQKGVTGLINFLITDGYFDDAERSDEIIEKMKKDGIVTVIINFNSYFAERPEFRDEVKYHHNCDHRIFLTDVDKLVPEMQKIISKVETKLKNKILEARK